MKAKIEKGQQYIMNTYGRFPLVLDKGEGMYVWDVEGKRYLDFVAGIATNSLGHGDVGLSRAVAEQAQNLIHCSNLYWTQPQVNYAEKLIEMSGFDKVFFCNSGAEAIEGSLKLIRKYGSETKRYEIITMVNSFHGRTYGAVSATGQAKYQQGFEPLLPGISHVPFNDFDALERAVTDKTAGIIIEPIQGEGGIVPAEKEAFLVKVRKLCDEKDILLVFDEIQCGIGRSGKMFAFEHYNVRPDICVLGKGIAGGVPMGAMLADAKVSTVLKPGEHASTFGGNPLATAAANVVIDRIASGLLDNVNKQAEYLTKSLEEMKSRHDIICDVRGVGLMQGIELTVPAAPIVQKCLERGLLLVAAGANVIRFVPALIVEAKNIDEAMSILEEALSSKV